MLPANTLAGQVALVTGGGTGLGKAIAIEMARAGAAIVIASRNETHRDAGVTAVEEVGGTAIGIGLDVRDADAIAAAFDEATAQLGPVSILVNNAAGNFPVPAENLSAGGWRAVVGIILDGTFLCSTEFARRRIAAEADGAILNIAATLPGQAAPAQPIPLPQKPVWST